MVNGNTMTLLYLFWNKSIIVLVHCFENSLNVILFS